MPSRHGQPGLKAFDERAGVQTSSYADYAKSIGKLIANTATPCVMMVSKIALKHMPPPDYSTRVKLNGNMADVAFWNGAFATGPDNLTLIRELAQQYDLVWDFCAGYGNTGRLFVEAGKRCILSDYNAHCCGYIAEHMEGWGK